MEQRIDVLVTDPRPPQSARLVGPNPRAYRLRQGDYRIVCEVDDAVLEVIITRGTHFRDVYERLDST